LSDAVAHAEVKQESLWAGGVSPFKVGSRKLGMWLFILSDALTFSALIIAYSYARASTPNWPTPFHFWPSIVVSSVMTFCLLTSSITMVLAVDAAHKGLRSRCMGWIFATMTGGLAFMLLHANEWRQLIEEGLRPFSNPWGAPMFGGTFFTLTGMHMFHVFTGLIYLGAIAVWFRWGKITAEDVEVSGLYWHFVDLVWMFIFPMVYLLSVKF
jgi:cytochrome c oxidase subunit 3